MGACVTSKKDKTSDRKSEEVFEDEMYFLNNSFIVIKSKYQTEDICVEEDTPDGLKKESLKFCCPICERYFSSLLVTVCCKNYVCHFCALSLNTNAGNIEVCCPHCRATPVLLQDVDPIGSIRYYSDSKNLKKDQEKFDKLFQEIENTDQ